MLQTDFSQSIPPQYWTYVWYSMVIIAAAGIVGWVIGKILRAKFIVKLIIIGIIAVIAWPSLKPVVDQNNVRNIANNAISMGSFNIPVKDISNIRIISPTVAEITYQGTVYKIESEKVVSTLQKYISYMNSHPNFRP